MDAKQAEANARLLRFYGLDATVDGGTITVVAPWVKWPVKLVSLADYQWFEAERQHRQREERDAA